MSKADSTHGQDDECITTVAEKLEGTGRDGQFKGTRGGGFHYVWCKTAFSGGRLL